MRNLVAVLFCATATAAFAADVPPGPSTGAKLTLGGAVKIDRFEFKGDVDAYRVQLNKGVNYGIAGVTTCLNKSVALYDRNFKRIAKSAVTDPFHDAWVELPVAYSGLYFAQITNEPTPPDTNCVGTGDADNAYRIAVIENCGADKRTICKTAIGTTGPRTIWAPTDKAWSYFDVTTAGVYTIIGLSVPYVDGSPNYWYAGGTLGLRRPDTTVLTEVAAGDPVQCSEGEACIRQKLTKPGRYFITLRMPWMSSDDSGPQRYRIGIEKTAPTG